MRHLPSIRASSPPLLHSLRHTGDFRSKLSVLWTKEATIIGLTAARERSLLLDTLSSPSSRRLQWDRFPPFFSPRTRLERRQEFSQRLRPLWPRRVDESSFSFSFFLFSISLVSRAGHLWWALPGTSLTWHRERILLPSLPWCFASRSTSRVIL